MTTKELQEKNDAELVAFVAEKREELRKIRFGTAGSTMRNVHAGKLLRKDVARALTIITSRNAKNA